MKRVYKIVIGLVILIAMSACNRYVVCPAYADEDAQQTEQNNMPS